MTTRAKSKAQSTTEYAILIALVAAALFGMQVYLKRGVQGRIKNLADQISPSQYESGQTQGNYITTQSGTITQIGGGKQSGLGQNQITETTQNETTTRTSYERVLPERAKP